MSINFPTYSDIVNSTRSDVAAELPSLDPTIFGSFARALTDSQSGRAFDIILLLKQLLKQMFPQTADGEYLERWAAYEGLSRTAATVASGLITITGTAATVVPTGTALTSSAGEQYETQAGVTLSAQIIPVTSITRLGIIATVTTTADHGLASNMEVTIAGADQSAYNGTASITVTGSDTFEYSVSGSPATPATGTITAAFDGEEVEVQSVNTGQAVNLESGAKLTLVTPISGVDNDAYVQFSEVGGGSDLESDESLLERVLQSRANPVANFNVAAIEKVCLAVAGVTRVKVKRVTPDIGDVTILFVRDNDTDIIPSAGEVADVKAAVVEISPANTSETSIVVTAPTPVETDFVITALSPDTATMRAAIQANLEAFYQDSVTFETDITEDKYRSAIIDTIDPDTGDELQSFTLSTPSGDIIVSTDEIGTLGDITFS